MKMFKSFCIALIMSLTMVQGASAILYTDMVLFNPPKELSGVGVFEWDHKVTSDFQVPFDTVNSASLTITAKRAVGQNDYISILNFNFGQLGFLNPGEGQNGNNAVETVFNLGTFGSYTTQFGWVSGQPLMLSLGYNQGTSTNQKLTLLSSVFRLDYNNIQSPVVPQAAPVPEPTTLLLLGGGLVALAVVRRRKQS